MRHRKPNRRGQGLTENIVIVALIAIGAIGVISLFGDNLRSLAGASSSSLSGAASTSTGASQAVEPEMLRRDLKTFAEQGSAEQSSQGGGGDRAPMDTPE